jgi:hypothetical protein
VRQGDIDPEQLLIFADITGDVAEIEAETRVEIDGALALLAQHDINESSCSCLQLTKSNHCDSFSYFNPAIPTPSIYSLPRISKTKIAGFVGHAVERASRFSFRMYSKIDLAMKKAERRGSMSSSRMEQIGNEWFKSISRAHFKKIKPLH